MIDLNMGSEFYFPHTATHTGQQVQLQKVVAVLRAWLGSAAEFFSFYGS